MQQKGKRVNGCGNKTKIQKQRRRLGSTEESKEEKEEEAKGGVKVKRVGVKRKEGSNQGNIFIRERRFSGTETTNRKKKGGKQKKTTANACVSWMTDWQQATKHQKGIHFLTNGNETKATNEEKPSWVNHRHLLPIN